MIIGAITPQCFYVDPTGSKFKPEGIPPLPANWASILAELVGTSSASASARLGPDYSAYHLSGSDVFPNIWMRPLLDVSGIDSSLAVYHWGDGIGTWVPAAGDFSSAQGQIIYVATASLTIDPITFTPNEGIGVDRVTVLEWTNGCTSEAPHAPTNDGCRPDSRAFTWMKFGPGAAIGRPIAIARGMLSWSNCGLILFSSGYIGVSGTHTAISHIPGLQLPANKKPTAISVSSKNEFALVTVVDTETMQGQVAVIALWGSGWITGFPHDWNDQYPGLPSVAVYVGMKVLGYVNLPFVFPTGVSAVSGWTDQNPVREKGGSGNAGLLSMWDLSLQEDRDSFDSGNINKNYAAFSGSAVVIAKYENKACFLDLTKLYDTMRKSYFTTQPKFNTTRPPGYPWNQTYPNAFTDENYQWAPNIWPYGFSFAPDLAPVILKTIDVTTPTACIGSIDGACQVAIASLDGTINFYNSGGLSNGAPSIRVGLNPCFLGYGKQFYSNGFIAVCRGDRELAWVSGWTGTPGVTKRLRDDRLIDPVSFEAIDTHGIAGSFFTVTDFAGKQLVEYRDSTLVFMTQGGATFGMGPSGSDAIECGGVFSVPGFPICSSTTNVN